MNKTIEKLKDLGCDIDDAMTRFLDDEDFYLECFDSVIHDVKFEELKQLVEQKDVEKAFECAHTLKGLVANIGLTSLYDIAVVIVEKLRAGSAEHLLEQCDALLSEREKYLSV